MAIVWHSGLDQRHTTTTDMWDCPSLAERSLRPTTGTLPCAGTVYAAGTGATFFCFQDRGHQGHAYLMSTATVSLQGLSHNINVAMKRVELCQIPPAPRQGSGDIFNAGVQRQCRHWAPAGIGAGAWCYAN